MNPAQLPNLIPLLPEFVLGIGAMALLLVGGVMNLLWIVLLALLAYLERVPSMGRLIARLAGIVLIAAGTWLFSMGMS